MNIWVILLLVFSRASAQTFSTSGTAQTPAGNTVAYTYHGAGACTNYSPLMYAGTAGGYNPGSTQGGGPGTNDAMIEECAKACLAKQASQAGTNLWSTANGINGSPRPAHQNGLRGFTIQLDDQVNPGRCFCELENLYDCQSGRTSTAAYDNFEFECPVGKYLDGHPDEDFTGECLLCGYQNKIYDSSGISGIGTNSDLAEPHSEICEYCPNDQDPVGPVLREKLGVVGSGFGRDGTTCGVAYEELDIDFSCAGGYCDDYIHSTCSGGSYVLSDVLAARFHRVGDDNDYCDDYMYLAAGQYPAGLSASDPLYNVNKLEECKNRCLAEDASYEGFFVRSYVQSTGTTYDVSNFGCGCCVSNGALRTTGGGNKYETYRIDDPNVYEATCTCQAGYDGERCQNQVCSTGGHEACQNGGTCFAEGTVLAKYGDSDCFCDFPYAGHRCEHDDHSDTPCSALGFDNFVGSYYLPQVVGNGASAEYCQLGTGSPYNYDNQFRPYDGGDMPAWANTVELRTLACFRACMQWPDFDYAGGDGGTDDIYTNHNFFGSAGFSYKDVYYFHVRPSDGRCYCYNTQIEGDACAAGVGTADYLTTSGYDGYTVHHNCADIDNDYPREKGLCLPDFCGGASCENGMNTPDCDDCDPNPCLNGGTCTDGQGTFSCACPPGTAGAVCESVIQTGAGSNREMCHTCDEVAECASGLTCGEPKPAGYGSGALDYTWAHNKECDVGGGEVRKTVNDVDDCATQCKYHVWEDSGTFKSRGFIYADTASGSPSGPDCWCESQHSNPHPECPTPDLGGPKWDRYDFNGHWEADYVWAHHQQCNSPDNQNQELAKTVTSIQDCADQCRGEVWSAGGNHQRSQGFIYRSRVNGGPACYCEAVHSHPHEECGTFASPDWHRYDFIPAHAFMHYGYCTDGT